MKLDNQLPSMDKRVQWYIRDIIDYVRYDIPAGLVNLFIYAPLIWRTREWDCGFLYEYIAFKLRLMEQHHREQRIISSWAHAARQLQIAAYSLERLIKDEYPGFKKYCERDCNVPREEFLRDHKRDIIMQQEDLERFGKLFVKYSPGWWS